MVKFKILAELPQGKEALLQTAEQNSPISLEFSVTDWDLTGRSGGFFSSHPAKSTKNY